MGCRVVCRLGSDPALLWLWCRLAAAAPIRLLAWEPPFAAGVALKGKKKKSVDSIMVMVRVSERIKNGTEWRQSQSREAVVERAGVKAEVCIATG